MTKDETNAALKKFSVGDSLTDVELNGLAKMFDGIRDDLHRLTIHFNTGFGLAHKEILSNFDKLKSYQIARAGK